MLLLNASAAAHALHDCNSRAAQPDAALPQPLLSQWRSQSSPALLPPRLRPPPSPEGLFRVHSHTRRRTTPPAPATPFPKTTIPPPPPAVFVAEPPVLEPGASAPAWPRGSRESHPPRRPPRPAVRVGIRERPAPAWPAGGARARTRTWRGGCRPAPGRGRGAGDGNRRSRPRAARQGTCGVAAAARVRVVILREGEGEQSRPVRDGPGRAGPGRSEME
jgi:hypothetical protein